MSNLEKQSEGLNLHNQRLSEAQSPVFQVSSNSLKERTQSRFSLLDWNRGTANAVGYASFTYGYENIVFQTNKWSDSFDSAINGKNSVSSARCYNFANQRTIVIIINHKCFIYNKIRFKKKGGG